MSNHGWIHSAKHAAETKGKDSKWGGIGLIVIGIFFAPMLFGIPLIIWGIAKLFSGDESKGH